MMEEQMLERAGLEPGRRMNRRDLVIVTIMTLVYLFMALINLGSFEAPQTGWEPDRLNESFVVDFGREVQIDKIFLYGGLGHAWGCFGSLEIKAWDGEKFVPYTFLDMKSIFRWTYSTDSVKTSKLLVISQYLRSDDEDESNRYYKAEYREMAFFSGSELIKDFTVTDVKSNQDVSLLFDEQELVPDRPSFFNGTYFDEIYFPRTALEQIEKRSILYENTHPPLGKTLLGIGIRVFGMNPFGWRIMGTLFGALMLPLMYLTGKRMFKDSFWAFFCTFLLMFDFMHFAQTRLATIDSYTAFFVMGTYLFMLDYYDSWAFERGFFRSLVPLLFSGIFLGLGGATKWIALYGAFGLAVLFFASRIMEYIEYNRRLDQAVNQKQVKPGSLKKLRRAYAGKYFVLTCLFCVLFFIIIPAAIYTLSFIPIQNLDDNRTLVEEVIDSVKSMYEYHKGVNTPHPYSSHWYEWPLMLRPIYYHAGPLLPEGMGSSIASFGNPMVWWTGFIAFFVMIWLLLAGKIKKNLGPAESRIGWFPIVGYLSLYLPWVIAPRKLTFIYHYFSCVPFLILMIAMVMRYLEGIKRVGRRASYILMSLVLVLFILYYPVLSGLVVPRWYLNALRILPGWAW
ncbi:MAG TPA: phospholipid carrier-dependent glycosyltransferase [Thermoclostridium sp.]|nr:phospholipid carrier-dependent glycosyltransferase [Thermoclostridium sp.]